MVHSERTNQIMHHSIIRPSGMYVFLLCLLIVIFSGCAQDTPQIIRAADGIPIAYESFGNGETTVVFVHCWTCNRFFWQHQIEPVAGAGYRVVTLDLPGHGESGRERDEWTIESLAADVATVVESLDLSRVILVGHSMGAPVSLAAAQRLPDRVTGIVSVDALHNVEFTVPEKTIEHFIGNLRATYPEMLEFFFSMFFPPDADPDVVEWVMSQIHDADPDAAIALMEDLIRLDESLLLINAGVPVRSINAAPYSEMSIATDIETNRTYADFDAVEMEGVGHILQMEQPEAFNEHLLRLLSKLSR
jgi:pimeloyl-ACP methyl ester carboxylesterase